MNKETPVILLKKAVDTLIKDKDYFTRNIHMHKDLSEVMPDVDFIETTLNIFTETNIKYLHENMLSSKINWINAIKELSKKHLIANFSDCNEDRNKSLITFTGLVNVVAYYQGVDFAMYAEDMLKET